MKFKVRGLVFVGFAAAILSANAMAVDNTVTSKEYVDTHFQTKVEGSDNQLVQSTGTAGSVKYLTISDSSSDVNSTNGAGKVVSGKAVADAITANNTDLNLSQYEVLTNKVQTIAASGEGSEDSYPSEKAVKAYVTTAGGNYQAASTTGQNQYVANGQGGWEALTTTATPAENSTTPFTAGGAYALDQAKEDVSNKTDTVAAAGSTDDDKYPSETAVRTAIDAVSTAAADAYQAKSTADLQIGTSGGVFRDMTTAEKAALASGLTSTKVGDYDTHIADTNIHVTTTDKANWNAKVDQAQGLANANKTLITDANGNVTVSSQTTSVVPALPASCTAGTPCALVTNETTNEIEWQPIAQATANVGE